MSSCSGANWSRFSKTQRAGVICDVLHPSFYFARLVYQYPPFLRHPYRVESFRKIISFILIRLRTVIRSVLMDFMAQSSLAASSFFFNFLFIVLRGPIVPDTNEDVRQCHWLLTVRDRRRAKSLVKKHNTQFFVE